MYNALQRAMPIGTGQYGLVRLRWHPGFIEQDDVHKAGRSGRGKRGSGLAEWEGWEPVQDRALCRREGQGEIRVGATQGGCVQGGLWGGVRQGEAHVGLGSGSA